MCHKALPFIDTTYSSWRYFCILEYMQNILNFKGTRYEYVKLSGSPHFHIGGEKKEAAYG